MINNRLCGWVCLLLLGLGACKKSSEQTLPEGVRVTITSDVDLDTIVLRARNRAGTETMLSEPVTDRDIKNVPLVLLIQKTDLVKNGFLLRVAGNKNSATIASGASVITFLDTGISDVSLKLTANYLNKDKDGDGFLPCAGGATCDCDDAIASTNPFRIEDCTTTTVDDDCSGTPIAEMGCGGCTTGETKPCSPIASQGAIPGMGHCTLGHITCVNGVWGTTCEGGLLPIAEVDNELDEDCDGVADNGLPCTGTSRACFRGLSGNAITQDIQNSYHFLTSTCKTGTQLCTQEGRSSVWGPCVGEVLPVGSTENACDGKNEDCDASLDEDFDQDHDGFTSCGSDCNANSGMKDDYVDCDDDNSAARPPEPTHRCFGAGIDEASVELCTTLFDDDCKTDTFNGVSQSSRVCDNYDCSEYFINEGSYQCHHAVALTPTEACQNSGECLSEVDACINSNISGAIIATREICSELDTDTCTGQTAPTWVPVDRNDNPVLNGVADCSVVDLPCQGGAMGEGSCQLAQGSPCDMDMQCIKGHCVTTNGAGKICCDTTCNDNQCQDCGTGTCTPITEGFDKDCDIGYCCKNLCVSAGGSYSSECHDSNNCAGYQLCNTSGAAVCDFIDVIEVSTSNTAVDNDLCGYSNNECRTLGHALTRLKTACGGPSLIRVASGDYTETQTIQIPRGVTIEGVGIVTITITPTVQETALLIDGSIVSGEVVIRNIHFVGRNCDPTITDSCMLVKRDTFGAIIRNTAARVELKNVSITAGNAGDGVGREGHASIGMWVLKPVNSVVLDNVTLVAGNAGKGSDGAQGANATENSGSSHENDHAGDMGNHGVASPGSLNNTTGFWSASSVSMGAFGDDGFVQDGTGAGAGGEGGYAGGLSSGLLYFGNYTTETTPVIIVNLEFVGQLKVTSGRGGQGGSGGLGGAGSAAHQDSKGGCGGAGAGGVSLPVGGTEGLRASLTFCGGQIQNGCVATTQGAAGAAAVIANGCPSTPAPNDGTYLPPP